MRESEIERYLKKQVVANGGKCWKWVSPGRRGVPDRIVIMPGGVVAFVELKAPGKTERPDQVRVQKILRDLGCQVYSSVDSKVKVDLIIAAMVPMAMDKFFKTYGIPENPVIAIFEHMQNGGDAK